MRQWARGGGALRWGGLSWIRPGRRKGATTEGGSPAPVRQLCCGLARCLYIWDAFLARIYHVPTVSIRRPSDLRTWLRSACHCLLRSRAAFRPGRAQLECRDRRPATAHRTTRPPAATVHGPLDSGPLLSRAASPSPTSRPPHPLRRPAFRGAHRAAPSQCAMASAAESDKRPTSCASGDP